MATVSEIFENIPNVFDAEKAGDLDATVQFDLSGEGGGKWYVIVANGECAVEEGEKDSPTSTIRMEASDYAAMVAGDLNPMEAFMQQKIRVEGDLNTVMKFQSIFFAGDTSYSEDLLLAGITDGITKDPGIQHETHLQILAHAKDNPMVYLPTHDPDAKSRLENRVTLMDSARSSRA